MVNYLEKYKFNHLKIWTIYDTKALMFGSENRKYQKNTNKVWTFQKGYKKTFVFTKVYIYRLSEKCFMLNSAWKERERGH